MSPQCFLGVLLPVSLPSLDTSLELVAGLGVLYISWLYLVLVSLFFVPGLGGGTTWTFIRLSASGAVVTAALIH